MAKLGFDPRALFVLAIRDNRCQGMDGRNKNIVDRGEQVSS